MKTLLRFRMLAVIATLLMLVTACNGETTTDSETETDTGTTTTETQTETDTAATETESAMGAGTEEPTESAMGGETTQVDVSCELDLPEDGPGSAEGMSQEPAATAASNNPELSTLVEAVQQAGLVDTLNDPEATYTIFAPANSAFEEIPEEDLNALLQDQEQLTQVLTYHVIADSEMDLQTLVDEGTVTSIQGGEVEISADDESTVTINGGQAEVICPNVETANATVHIIDGVLMPDSMGGMESGSDMGTEEPTESMTE